VTLFLQTIVIGLVSLVAFLGIYTLLIFIINLFHIKNDSIGMLNNNNK